MGAFALVGQVTTVARLPEGADGSGPALRRLIGRRSRSEIGVFPRSTGRLLGIVSRRMHPRERRPRAQANVDSPVNVLKG